MNPAADGPAHRWIASATVLHPDNDQVLIIDHIKSGLNPLAVFTRRAGAGAWRVR
jgi:hypothetical protein